MARNAETPASRSMLASICAVAVCAFLWPAVVTFDTGDWPSPNQYPHNVPSLNACGAVGAWFAYQLRYYLGDGVHPLLLFLTLAAIIRLARGEVGNRWERGFGLALVVACTSASSHLISEPGAADLPVGHGGLIGFGLGDLLRNQLDRLGTLIVLTSSFVVGLIFVTQGWLLKVPTMLRRVGDAPATTLLARGAVALAGMPRALWAGAGVSAEERRELLDEDTPAADRKPPRTGHRKRAVDADNSEDSLGDEPDESDDAADDEYESAEVEGVEPNNAQRSTKRRRSRKSKSAGQRAAGPVIRFMSQPEVDNAEPYPREIENWRLPSIDLLKAPEYGFSEQQELVVRKQAQILEQTLEEFRLDARVVEIDTGPVITMFELKLGAGIKVSQIATLSNDIARALRAHAIRVVAPISGKNTVGIEVPNTDKETVRLAELMTVAGRRASNMVLPLFLGKDAGGEPLVVDLTTMPHLLVAGTTGSGKSVSLNAIILSLLMTKRPDHVKMILIDPKMVELSQFKDVPHLMSPIVTDLVQAEKILEWVVTKMDERYALIAEARVKNIAGYNRLGKEELLERLSPASDDERARIPAFLPYIVMVIDELADLMMTAGKEVEHHLSRLAQKSRAVGIHIIVATQRPEAKVVTGLIKSNLPSRICFRVASRMDSRIVLDQNGGEVLLGQGDMLFLPPGSHKLMRAQGTYLEDAEVQAVLDDLGSRAKPEFHPELVRLRSAGANVNAQMRDPLFDEAVREIIQSKRGSVSLLQRRLTIGYSRASRLIDQMAQAGIVGEYKGSQAREVLMTSDQWAALQAQVEADQEQGYEADAAQEEADGLFPDDTDTWNVADGGPAVGQHDRN